LTFFVVFFSYAVITPDRVALFVEDKQLDESVKKYLGQDVELKPYGSFFEYLKSLSSSLNLGADYVRSIPFFQPIKY